MEKLAGVQISGGCWRGQGQSPGTSRPAALCQWKWATDLSVQAISCHQFAFLAFTMFTDLDIIL